MKPKDGAVEAHLKQFQGISCSVAS